MMLGAEEARRLVRATGRTPLEVASRAADDDGVDAMTPSTKSAVSQLRRIQKIQRILNRTVIDDEYDDDDLEEETNHKEESYFGWGMKKLVNGLKDLGNSSGHDAEEENDENTKPRSVSPPPPPPKNLPKLKGGGVVRDKSPERRYVDVMSQFNTTTTSTNSKKN